MSATSEFERLLTDLETMSFYKYVAHDDLEPMKHKSVETLDPFPDMYRYKPHSHGDITWRIVDVEYPDATKRAFFVDAEELYEAGLIPFLEEVAPLVRQRGPYGGVTDGDPASGEMRVELSGRITSVYFPGRIDPWSEGAAMRQGFTFVNQILTLLGSDERVFYRGGGNDMQMIFLTEEMYRVIRGCSSIPGANMPKTVQDRG